MKRIMVFLFTISMVFGIKEMAPAALIGDTILLEHHYPVVGTIYEGQSFARTVTAGIADHWFWAGSYDINPEDSTIFVNGVAPWTLDPVPFNGLVVSSIDDTIYGVTVNTNLGGWDDSRLYFDNHSIRFNYSGLHFDQNTYFDASLNFNPQAIPEPATLSLFGLGLLGLVFRRKR